MRNLLLFGLLSISILSCKDDKTTYEIDDEIIRGYLTKKGLNAEKHSSGLYYIIEQEGNGIFPTINSNVEIKYKAYTATDSVIDPGINTYTTPLNGDIFIGWKYGIPKFSEGGKGKLFLPRHLADGYSVVIFDIELREVWD